MALSKTTKDHDEIRQWAEARGAVPAEIASTAAGNRVGILRFQFANAPHANDSALQEISWEEFFEKFDASGLELVYQEQTAEGAESNFNKLIYPENEHASKDRSSSKKASAAKKSSAKKAAAKTAKKAASAKKSTMSGGKSAASRGASSHGKHASSSAKGNSAARRGTRTAGRGR